MKKWFLLCSAGQPGQGLPDPIPADYKGGIYLVPQYSNRGFMSVKPE